MILPSLSLKQFIKDNSSLSPIERAITFLPNVLVSLDSPDDIETSLHHFKDIIRPFNYSVLLNVQYSDEALALLDIGVNRAILSCDNNNELNDLMNCSSNFPKERLGCLINYDHLKDSFLAHLPTLLETFGFIGFKSSSSDVVTKVQQLSQSQHQVFKGKWLIQVQEIPDLNVLSQLIQNNVELVCSVSQITLSNEPVKSPLQLDLADALVCPLKSDREDGLFPTCVVDEFGVNLGLVYSSVDSIREALKTGQGVYFSRKRGLWHKGVTSGDHQELIQIQVDCDFDTLKFTVNQHGSGFCHLKTLTCFGKANGLIELERTIQNRKRNAPEGSYTHRLFTDSELLSSKIMEEAEELCQAQTGSDVSWEAADLLYFAMVKCAKSGVKLSQVLSNLERKSFKLTRRPGDAKPKWSNSTNSLVGKDAPAQPPVPALFKSAESQSPPPYQIQSYINSEISENERSSLLKRPIIQYKEIASRVEPILSEVRHHGDKAIIEFTSKFDRVDLEDVTLTAPFPEEMMKLDSKTKNAIDTAYANILKFHEAQYNKDEVLEVETTSGVTCTRFTRPIQRVGLYVPGGTAVLPSTALMLGIPAKVAGCEQIVVATPPRPDGSIVPEVVYVSNLIGATHIVKAGGAQAVASMAYGTASVPKVDKICGPGNQYVTCAKMIVQNDSSAMVAIDMPAGPSEVLVIADHTANPAFVASDLLSQAEHGPDSQVVLITVNLNSEQTQAIMAQIEAQAKVLPRKDIVIQSLAHSYHLVVDNMDEAIEFSNEYAPEHLILQVDEAQSLIPKIMNAGSVFVGHYSPESCGDYASGTNHTLPTYGFARMYSGVSTSTFLKYITSQNLTQEGIKNLGPTVEHLANIESLHAHANAVRVRLDALNP